MIRVAHLHKVFPIGHNRVSAVAGVDFHVDRAEVFVLLGPSGCGKSTTLRCIAGLEVPDQGEVYIDGQLMSSAAKRVFVQPEDREIAMVFQSHAVWPHMTVLDNVAFPLRDGRARMPKRQALERAREALHLVRLDGLEDRPATQLSGGQQQRVALARALALEPKVLLMDEPLSNLDAALRELMREELKTLFTQLRLTVVYVTHDQVEALSLGMRVAVMHDGALLQTGTPEEVYERPANIVVLKFLGGCNLIAGEVTGPGEITTAVGTICQVAVDAAGSGTSLLVAIRPDDIECLSAPRSGQELQAIVKKRSFLGDSILLELLLDNSTIKARVDRHIKSRPGDAVWVSFRPEGWRVVPNDAAAPYSTDVEQT